MNEGSSLLENVEMHTQSPEISRTSHIHSGTAQKQEHVEGKDFVKMGEYKRGE
jgi:hypothetical protein